MRHFAKYVLKHVRIALFELSSKAIKTLYNKGSQEKGAEKVRFHWVGKQINLEN